MRKSITVSESAYQALKAVKWQFDMKATTKYKWIEFISQLTLLGEFVTQDDRKLVELERIGKWFGQAECPYCKTENSPLKLKDGIVWGVICRKCGKRFIAIM